MIAHTRTSFHDTIALFGVGTEWSGRQAEAMYEWTGGIVARVSALDRSLGDWGTVCECVRLPSVL